MSHPHSNRQPSHGSHRSGLNVEDIDILNAERDAFPERWHDYDPNNSFRAEYDRLHPNRTRTNNTEGIEERAEEEEDEEIAAVEDASRNPSNAGPSRNANLERIETQHSVSGSSISSVNRPNIRQRTGSTLSKTSTRMERDFMQYLDRHPTALARISEHRLQHSMTVGTSRSKDGLPLPDFGGGKPYPPMLPEQEEYVVEFSGHDDPRHAQNWKLGKKITISAVLILYSLAATLASSIFSAATEAVGAHFHVGREVVTLCTSLFVLGYAIGPVIFAPLSELYGRKFPVTIAAFGFGIFNTGVATAANFQTVVICRFFAGIFGAAPLALTAAVFSDMFNNKSRGLAVALFSAVIFNGPFLGPMIGGFITKSYLGWRWTAWIPSFMGYAAGVLSLFLLEESYGPVILVAKASELRRLTRNWGIHAKQEEVEVDFGELVTKNLSRPLRILFTEPIVLLITIYMSFIYGLLYLCLTAYDLIFAGVHHFSLGVEGLPYMALNVGVIIGLLAFIALDRSYVRKLEANNNIPVPEWRLPLVMVGGVSFAGSLFWLGWTGYRPGTPWIVPTLSGLFLGFGIYTVFLQSLNYIIDAYLMFAASAIAANTIMRSVFGAVFPLFAVYMFEGMGIQYALTLLGCVATAFIPMPFLFYRYGKRIRGMSKFAPAPDIKADRERAKREADEEARGGSSGEFADEAAEKPPVSNDSGDTPAAKKTA